MLADRRELGKKRLSPVATLIQRLQLYAKRLGFMNNSGKTAGPYRTSATAPLRNDTFR
jgi:hypothetical protein